MRPGAATAATRISAAALSLAITPALAPSLAAQESAPKTFVDLYALVVAADGEPANDLLGAGVSGRFRFGERWWWGLALDHSPGFDVETPYEALGLEGAEVDGEVVDAEASMTLLSVFVERAHPGAGGRFEGYWGGGIGAATVDAEDVTGPIVGGGSFDIRQEVGTELVARLFAGVRLRFGERWRIDLGARADQHFTDWELTDRVSGASGSFDDYLVAGVQIGVGVGF